MKLSTSLILAVCRTRVIRNFVIRLAHHRLGGIASKRGIRRCEVRFLMGTQNFLCPTLVTRRKTSFSVMMNVLHSDASSIKYFLVTRPHHHWFNLLIVYKIMLGELIRTTVLYYAVYGLSFHATSTCYYSQPYKVSRHTLTDIEWYAAGYYKGLLKKPEVRDWHKIWSHISQ